MPGSADRPLVGRAQKDKAAKRINPPNSLPLRQVCDGCDAPVQRQPRAGFYAAICRQWSIAKVGWKAFGVIGITGGLVLAGGSIYDTKIASDAVATMREHENEYKNGTIGKNGADPEKDHTAEENAIRFAEGKALDSAEQAVVNSEKAIYTR